MRWLLYLSAAVLELCAAAVLFALVWELPSPADLRTTFDRAEQVGQRSQVQVHRLREQLHSFGERQPEMQRVSGQLQKQLAQVSRYLGSQQTDFKAIEAVRDAMGDVADGLTGFGQALDPKTAGRLSQALGATAAFVDGKVAPAANRAADQLEAATDALQIEAENLSAQFRARRPETQPLRPILGRLERIDGTLAWLSQQATPTGVRRWQKRLESLQKSADTAADRASVLAEATYPSMTFSGLVPTVVEKPIWPGGKATVKGLHQAAGLFSRGARYLDTLTEKTAPAENVLNKARKGILKVRQILQYRENHDDGLVPLPGDLQANAIRLAEVLPKLGRDLAHLLRDTDRLKEVANVLRQAQKGINSLVESWPELQQKLGRSVVVLRTTRDQLTYALEHRSEYEASLKGVSVLANTLASSLPVFTNQLERDLSEQETSLRGLEQSIDDATGVLPQCESQARRIVQLTRLLLTLLAVITCLHAGYLTHRGWNLRIRQSAVSASPSQDALALAPADDCG